MRPSLKLLLLTLPFAAAGAGFLGITVRTKAPPARIEARDTSLASALAGLVQGRLMRRGLRHLSHR